MFFIDTNVFFEWILGRKNAKDCERLLNLAVDAKLFLVCSHFSIHSICIILTKDNKINDVKKFLDFIYKTPYINVVNLTVEDDKEILEIIENTGLDFDDALQYYCARQMQCEAIITFDKDFKKTKIRALTPADVI